MSPKTKAADTAATGDEYGADQIRKLEGLEAVRLRPGMYIGGTGQGPLHHLINEIVDNAVDEALAGHCTEIVFTLNDKNVVEVADNGRGVPVAKSKQTGESALYMVYEELHAGGKFGDGGYKVSGGLHGVGASVTNALSHWLEVEVRKDGALWTARWKQGKRDKDIKKVRELKKGESNGTTVRWLYDDTIFDKEAKYIPSLIESFLRQKAHLVRGLKFVVNLPGHKQQVFLSKNGIGDLIRELNSELSTAQIVNKDVIFFSSDDLPQFADKELDVPVEVALQWTDQDEERLYSFANIVPNPDGGTHAAGLRAALSRAMNQFAKQQGKFKKDNESFDGKDVMDGLVAAVSVKVADVSFESQTKAKLLNPEARTAVQTFTYAAFSSWLADPRNAGQAKKILERCLEARDVRMAKAKVSKKVKATASVFSMGPLAEKLDDCEKSRPVETRELFIVEGDSAAGTGKQARDKSFQAILPVRGKVLNVLGQPGAKAFANKEIESILTALGGRTVQAGRRVVADLPDAERRYGKVVIMTDADTDGAHICMLLLTLFHELFPRFLEEGRVFISQPPLFRIKLNSQGTEYVYAFSDEERAELLKKHKRSGDDVSRFKGLGEMEPENLRETCFDPETRALLQVSIEDAAQVTEAMTLLMAKGKESARRAWLEEVGLDTEAV